MRDSMETILLSTHLLSTNRRGFARSWTALGGKGLRDRGRDCEIKEAGLRLERLRGRHLPGQQAAPHLLAAHEGAV